MFLIGFYFGGMLATLLGLIAAAIQYEYVRDLLSDNPVKVFLILCGWPYALPKAIHNLISRD